MKLDLNQDFDKQKATTYLGKMMEKGSFIEIKEIRSKRTINQNSYLHVCFSIIALDLGYTLQEIKTVLKRQYGMTYEKNGNKFLKSTTELDTVEMTHFIDWLREFSMDQFGVYIPTSEEYIENQIAIEKQIQYAR